MKGAKLGKPVKYIGIKPKMIIEKLKNNVRKDAEDKMHELSRIKTTNEFEALETLYHGGLEPVKKEDVSIALKGRSNISNHVREIMKNAKEEIVICTNAKELFSKNKLFRQTFESLSKTGVKLKVALSGEDKLINEASKIFGMKFKKINVNVKFFIIDRKEILFYLSKGKDEEDSAIWINSEFFAQAFAALFEKALKN